MEDSSFLGCILARFFQLSISTFRVRKFSFACSHEAAMRCEKREERYFKFEGMAGEMGREKNREPFREPGFFSLINSETT
jgi:hypothetical protein